MDSIDLLALVKRFGKLNNIELYGYISSRLPRPANLFSSVETPHESIFVKMEVLGVNLSKYSQHLKEMGITNKENNDIYLVNGAVALLVDSHQVFPDWYATRGTLRLGSKTDNSYLTLFDFNKVDDKWSIRSNILNTMEISDWSRDSRLYLSVNRSLENGFVTVPDDVKQFQRFNAVQYKGIVTSVNNNNKSLNDSIKESMNGVTPVEVLTSTNNFKVENRDTIKPLPEKYTILEGNLNKTKKDSVKFIKSLKEDYNIDVVYSDVQDSLRTLVNGLRRYIKSKPSNFASTGRVLLKKYLSKFGDYSSVKYLGTTVEKYFIDIFDEIAEFILDHDNRVDVDGKAWTLCKKAFGNEQLFYTGMLAIILGVDYDKCIEVCEDCISKDINFIKLIITNPYLLLLVSSSFSYQEVDYIAYCLGKLNDKSIEEYKLVGIIFDYLNNSDNGSTTYKYQGVLNSKIGTSLTKAKFNQCRSAGTYLTDTVRQNIHYYINNTLDISVYKYPSSGWVQQGSNYVLPLTKSELQMGVSSAIKYGVVIKYNINNIDWISSAKLVEKELYICQVLYDISKEKKGYDHALIDKYIDEYENKVGFKLEKEQRDAVHLVDNYASVVTGPAGSGKTTVSDCMVYVLNKLDDTLDIQYAAPTGKAAKRLQEVVKKPVQTFNSKFKIFSGSDSLLDTDENSSSSSNISYFFDEVAMTNVNLMYMVCKHLEDCQVFFLGDICQLPPIGKGLPFKNFLRFLPCVKLNVSKRSAESSGITYNSKVINECSEADNWLDLKESTDFKILPCSDDEIKRITVLLCKFHLGSISDSEMTELCNLTRKSKSDFIHIDGLTADDIQVVSPIGKQTYSWGTYQLNLDLQKVFNSTHGYANTFKYQVSENYAGTKFTINDRVIHTDANMYTMQWYSSYEGGCFQKTYGFGIANGDVGKVVGFYPSQTCEFENESGKAPEDFKYPDNLRDDSSFVSDNNWFIVVEYYDFMSDSNYYILYRATENLNVNANECKVFIGDDLKKLALFYAGTTHKMQGSQSKLIIGVLGRVNFNGFLTRNMLYTEVTRASDGVYLIGSVSNSRNSQLSIARSCVADDNVDTISELIFEE